jgi:hypothetical protein
MIKWLKPERKDRLIELWNTYGCKCNYGHNNCAIESHYVQNKSIRVPVITGIDKECFNPNGNKILDTAGNPAINHTFVLSYKTIDFKVVEYTDMDGIELYIDRFNLKAESLKKTWIQSDRTDTRLKYQAEYANRHNLKDRLPLRGTFSGIAQDIYYDNSPVYRIEAYGIDALTFKPFVKLRMTASSDILYVDLSPALKGLSKNKKHKVMRYSKNGIAHEKIESLCNRVVKDHLS